MHAWLKHTDVFEGAEWLLQHCELGVLAKRACDVEQFGDGFERAGVFAVRNELRLSSV
jgi:hypothetical protein